MNINRWLSTLPLRLRSLFRRDQVARELSDELQHHLEQKTHEYLAAGLTPEEARRKGRREFGGLELSKENCRDTRRVGIIETVFQNIRFGLRMLRKNLGFTAIAVLTLGLGIGATPRQGVWIISAGVLSGLALTAAIARLVGNFISGVSPYDPLTYLSVSALLRLVALLASSIPAPPRHACRSHSGPAL